MKEQDNYQIVDGPYGQTKLPANKRYIIDNEENRLLMKEYFGKSTYDVVINSLGYCYLEFDIKTHKWKPSFSYQWLYTNQPPLTDIIDIIDMRE